MTDAEKAATVLEALKTAEHEPAQAALSRLNELVGLVQADGAAPLKVEPRQAAQ